MGELQRSRVAELVIDGGLISARRGSGYLLSPTAVLTAAHVVRGAVSVLVRFNADRHDEWESPAAVEFDDSASDLGVVVLTTPAPPGVVGAVEFGELGDRAAVVPFEAVGFPRFKLRVDALADRETLVTRYRDAAHLHGMIASLANSREGTLELVTDPPDRDPDPRHSPWEGMSGAAVWCAGRIVGVISEHHPRDGLNRLAATPFRTASRQLGHDRWQDLAFLVGLPSDPAGLVDVSPTSVSDSISEGSAAKAREIAPTKLVGRDDELIALTRFCAGEELYQWWRADPWYGKTALASWLVLHPPAGVRVVSFFVTGGLASDHSAYTRAMVEQLAAITGETNVLSVNLLDWSGQRIRLMDKAAEQMHAIGQRLLLVVDGLDEDRRAPPEGPESIAAQLPRHPPPGLRVLVTSRSHPGIPSDVTGDHPLRSCRVQELSQSDQARQIEVGATSELAEHLAAGDMTRVEILGFITAAGSGLTLSELAELMHLPLWTVESRVTGSFGRSLKSRAPSALDPPDTKPVLIFGHEALREQSRRKLGSEIHTYRERIDRWVRKYRRRDWPDDSPRFVFRPYARLLTAAMEGRLLAGLATDRRRHDRMFRQTSADMDALEEISDAYDLLKDAPAPRDIVDLILLAFERDRLAGRGTAIPTGLPAVWVTLGDYPRAFAMARSITDDVQQVQALTAVATALAAAGQLAAAHRLANDAERIARKITNHDHQVEALTAVATALAGSGQTADAHRLAIDAEHLARSITNHDQQAEAFTAVATALAAAGQTTDAEHLARSITNDYRRTWALTDVASALAAAGETADARRLAIDAEQLARSITDDHQQAEAFTAVVTALAAAGQTADTRRLAIDAERLVRSITDDDQAWGLIAVAAALAAAGETGDVHRLAIDAERLARSITNNHEQAQALTYMADALATAGETGDARRLAIDAERLARSIINDHQQVRAITAVAAAMATAGQFAAAHRLAIDAEQLTRSITNTGQQTLALTVIATVLATAVQTAEAERVARIVTDMNRRVQVFGERPVFIQIATALALAGQTADAERVARSITHDYHQAQALTEIATALATAGQTTDAERIARSITNSQQAQALTEIATALAASGQTTDAERIARSITNTSQQAQALTDVASALAAAGETADGHRLAIDAERLARSISDTEQQTRALTAVARAMAIAGQTADVHRLAIDAERLARSMSGTKQQTRALTAVAWAVAPALATVGQTTDAERIARSITNDNQQAQALTEIATALAASGQTTDAERIARSITNDNQQAQALSEIATALAACGQTTDAERICIERLLTPNWASFLPTLVSLSTSRDDHNGFTARLASGLSHDRPS